MHPARLRDGVDVLPKTGQVLRERERRPALAGVADQDRDLGHLERGRGAHAPVARDEPVVTVERLDQDRLQHPVLLDRGDQFAHGPHVDLAARVLGLVDLYLIERDDGRGASVCRHGVSFLPDGAARAAPSARVFARRRAAKALSACFVNGYLLGRCRACLRGGERPPALPRRGRRGCASAQPSRWHNRQPRERARPGT
jgi:hypothetical protein